MNTPIKINSISTMHQLLSMKKNVHPLISIFNFDNVQLETPTLLGTLITDFYIIVLKKDCAGGKCKYGQQYYDFDSGIMYFIAPNQVMQFEDVLLNGVKGFVLVVHPDFFNGYSISSSIKNYGFFSYKSNEALHLSEKEEDAIMQIIENMNKEINSNLDAFSQDLLVSNTELLLKYCDRYYNRQFLTRKKANTDLLTKFETLLNQKFTTENIEQFGLPSVQTLAQDLNLSANYLSDMLRVQTGQSTQQYIQDKIIEKAKVLLSTTNLSVSEIAYQLGFEHTQSFHRLFKNKTTLAPLKFREQFN